MQNMKRVNIYVKTQNIAKRARNIYIGPRQDEDRQRRWVENWLEPFKIHTSFNNFKGMKALNKTRKHLLWLGAKTHPKSRNTRRLSPPAGFKSECNAHLQNFKGERPASPIYPDDPNMDQTTQRDYSRRKQTQENIEKTRTTTTI
jgi:hypothetical protein